MSKIFFLTAAVCIMASSCRPEEEPVPTSVIQPDTMISLMADIHLAEAVMIAGGMESGNSILKSAYLHSVLEKASIDTARFTHSFDYYSVRPELFSKMYEKVIEELSKRQAGEK